MQQLLSHWTDFMKLNIEKFYLNLLMGSLHEHIHARVSASISSVIC